MNDHLTQFTHDHDLLVRVDEKLNNVIADMKNIGEKLKQVDNLEAVKVDKVDFKSMEIEVEALKVWRWIQAGAIIIIMALVIPMGVYIFKLQTSSLGANSREDFKIVLQEVLSEYEKP